MPDDCEELTRGNYEYQSLGDSTENRHRNSHLLAKNQPGTWERKNIPEPPQCTISGRKILANYHSARIRTIYMPPMHYSHTEKWNG